MQLPEVSKKNLAIIVTITLIGVIALGIFLAWFNTGDLYTGLHDYGMSIVVMTIGIFLIFIKNSTIKTIGIMMFVAGLLNMLMGTRMVM